MWWNVDVVYIEMSVVYGDSYSLMLSCGVSREEWVCVYFSEGDGVVN